MLLDYLRNDVEIGAVNFCLVDLLVKDQRMEEGVVVVHICHHEDEEGENI
jgi:hypothetical protein